MVDNTIYNIVFLIVGALIGGIIARLLLRDKFKELINKKEIEIATLKAGRATEDELMNSIKDGAAIAAKPVVSEVKTASGVLQTAISDLKIREASLKQKEESHADKIKKQETMDQYVTSVRSVNSQKKMEEIIKNMGFIEPQMVEFRKKQSGINGEPDATLKFPYGRKLMCDSKAPLEYFDELFEAGKKGEDGKVSELKKKLALAIKKHIDDLNKTAYFKADDAFPYVIMFLPSERILQIVRELGNLFSNKDIDAYARDKNIVIAGPSTFYPQIENIQALWQEFKNNQNTNKVLNVITNSFNSIRIVTDKVSSFNSSLNSTIKAANSLNTSIFKTLGQAAKKAKELGYSDENVIKILEEDNQNKEKEFSKIDERG